MQNNLENNIYSREKIKLIITEDLILRSPIWAMIMLMIWGAISYLTIWIIMNLILPNYEQNMKGNNSKKEVSKYERIIDKN